MLLEKYGLDPVVILAEVVPHIPPDEEEIDDVFAALVRELAQGISQQRQQSVSQRDQDQMLLEIVQTYLHLVEAHRPTWADVLRHDDEVKQAIIHYFVRPGHPVFDEIMMEMARMNGQIQ